MRYKLLCLAAVAVGTMFAGCETGAQTPAQHAAAGGSESGHASVSEPAAGLSQSDSNVNDPNADPRAMVVVGKARFTVLTPEMIRLEWAADGKFEDHASFAFLNRRLPVPRFRRTFGRKEEGTIRTSALTLVYTSNGIGDGRFTPDNLTINLSVADRLVAWRPGTVDERNLQGTTRTLDGALGGKTKEPMDPGLISRDGWVVVDDSARPLFDCDRFQFQQGENSPWPWVMQRPAGERQDWYFFGYGHDYKQALGDFIKVAGRIPLPPRFAFGAWWSRYWAYTDQELEELVAAASARTTCRSTCWSSTWTGTRPSA